MSTAHSKDASNRHIQVLWLGIETAKPLCKKLLESGIEVTLIQSADEVLNHKNLNSYLVLLIDVLGRDEKIVTFANKVRVLSDIPMIFLLPLQNSNELIQVLSGVSHSDFISRAFIPNTLPAMIDTFKNLQAKKFFQPTTEKKNVPTLSQRLFFLFKPQ